MERGAGTRSQQQVEQDCEQDRQQYGQQDHGQASGSTAEGLDLHIADAHDNAVPGTDPNNSFGAAPHVHTGISPPVPARLHTRPCRQRGTEQHSQGLRGWQRPEAPDPAGGTFAA